MGKKKRNKEMENTGGGAGIGAAAGPVGAADGALVGLAVYGVYSLVKTD